MIAIGSLAGIIGIGVGYFLGKNNVNDLYPSIILKE